MKEQKNLDKRILRIPQEELIIGNSGNLDYPELLVECEEYQYCEICSRCLLALSTRLYKAKWYESYRKNQENLPDSIVYCSCGWWSTGRTRQEPPYPLPSGIRLKFNDEDYIYESTDRMTPKLYRRFLPLILDLYEFGRRKKNTEDTGR